MVRRDLQGRQGGGGGRHPQTDCGRCVQREAVQLIKATVSDEKEGWMPAGVHLFLIAKCRWHSLWTGSLSIKRTPPKRRCVSLHSSSGEA